MEEVEALEESIRGQDGVLEGVIEKKGSIKKLMTSPDTVSKGPLAQPCHAGDGSLGRLLLEKLSPRRGEKKKVPCARVTVIYRRR
ncbi:hypothetical protein M885DRAFT_527153 [Pelagophyceae sp. CCMP2097]|nr:hypothetical protein M885DRAFT_527153 [Pelagophyceae sp. CCMP2097]